MSMREFSQNPGRFIGKNIKDSQVADLLQAMVLDYEEPSELWANDFSGGISLLFTGESRESLTLETIFIFVSLASAAEASLEDSFEPFNESLPFELKRSMGATEVEELFGEPISRRKEVANSPVGFLGAALKYRLSDTANVLIEFKESKIHRIVVTD